MPAPTEVQYVNPENKQIQDSIGVTNLNFVVVNNPQPLIPFEALKKFNFPAELMPTSARQSLISTYIDTVHTKYFKVLHQTLADGQHSLPLDNHSASMTCYDETDDSKLSPGALRSKNNGLRLAYMNRFTMALSGTTNSTYTYSNGHSFTIDTDNTADYNVLLYDNIPLTALLAKKDAATAEIPEITQVTNNVDLIIYMPYEIGDRFSIENNIAKDNLHKFDYYVLEANQSIDTKVFADATYTLLHVPQGSITVGGYTVDAKNFYEGDATSAMTLTAGDQGAIVIMSVKVPNFGTA